MAMPVIDGFALIAALNRIGHDVRVIATTGNPSASAMTKIAKSGVAHILIKPYTADHLLRTIATVLAEPERNANGAAAVGHPQPRASPRRRAQRSVNTKACACRPSLRSRPSSSSTDILRRVPFRRFARPSAPAAQDAQSPHYFKYLRRKFAELKFCAIMPAEIQSAGRLRSTI